MITHNVTPNCSTLQKRKIGVVVDNHLQRSHKREDKQSKQHYGFGKLSHIYMFKDETT